MRLRQFRKTQRSRPSPALVISIVALIVALAGTATAAVIVTSPGQLGKNVVTSTKIRAGAITPSKLSAGSKALFRSTVTAAGGAGFEAQRVDGPHDINGGESSVVATGTVPNAGTYAFIGKTVINNLGNKSGNLLDQNTTASSACTLDANGRADDGHAFTGGPFGKAPGTIVVMVLANVPAGATVKLTCHNPNKWSASNTEIIVIPMPGANSTAVSG